MEKMTVHRPAHLKEFHRWASTSDAVLHFSLFGEVVSALNWGYHPLDGEKGCQVGCVRWDKNECEEPPDAAHYTTTEGSERGLGELGYSRWLEYKYKDNEWPVSNHLKEAQVTMIPIKRH